MVILSHPTGNTFVRALLGGLREAGLLKRFYTTIAFPMGSNHAGAGFPLLESARRRRSYDLDKSLIRRRPWREAGRLLSSAAGWQFPTRHEKGWASVDAVYQSLDRFLARSLERERPSHVYCYEDGALQTFRRAGELGIRRIYDLPIAYWETARRILEEEVERWPGWRNTLPGRSDSAEKRERKTMELEWADAVVCPSQFVVDSLPETVRRTKKVLLVPFGSPARPAPISPERENASLRVLFAGSMSQRKGLADIFAAMKMLERSDVELVVMGSMLEKEKFYRSEYESFVYEPPRAHAAVLELMRGCDLLVLPSLLEGRALVQQEALACGLPLIVTRNAGGEDLIEEGRTGFLVPIRSPEKIAEKINWFAENRDRLPEMRRFARRKAAEFSWDQYVESILQLIHEETVQ